MESQIDAGNGRVTKVVVATSVMLSFISFWRAAAIVLNDLGSSAFYAGGIAEQAIGHAAPWFIFGVMLFSYAVRSVYVESCAMFTRGGVYRVVKEAMGGTLAKLSVSALMFDFILTGPISAVSAGQYIVGLIAQTSTYLGYPMNPSPNTINHFAAVIAVLVTIYFWWRNTKGIHESSDDALKIMYVTTAMIVLLIAWCGFTILTNPDKQRLPPAPVPHNLAFDEAGVGWMPKVAPNGFRELPPETSAAATPAAVESHPSSHWGLIPHAGALLGLIGIFMAFGHSFLAMSGEESLAQVNRELEYPKHKNLMRAGMVIFVYSLLFTSLISFFAYAIIPDTQRPQFFNNLISGIAVNLSGPTSLKLLFQGFIVVVGFLMLAGAVNTAIIGSNGVLNRLSEDGVLTDWFRAPHKRYGTSYRMINMIVIMQLAAIIGSRGDTYTLGEAYAFGVCWSFAFNGLAMVVLRFKDKSPREWKVPFNITIGRVELPVGLIAVATILFTVAVINLITKQVATISGVVFTLAFFAIFALSEHLNERRRGANKHVEMDQFRVQPQDTISTETVRIRPGNTLCLVRDYNTLEHVRQALEMTHTGKTDLVMMSIQVMRGPDVGYEHIAENQLFTSYEQLLFSRVVGLAEKAGKKVHLLVVPSSDVFQAIVHTALQLDSSTIIAGRSSVMEPVEQAKRLGEAWERLPQKPRHQIMFTVVDPDGTVFQYSLGAHAPRLTDKEINQIHDLWLNLIQEKGVEDLHHKDIVAIALARLETELKGAKRQEVVDQVRRLTIIGK